MDREPLFLYGGVRWNVGSIEFLHKTVRIKRVTTVQLEVWSVSGVQEGGIKEANGFELHQCPSCILLVFTDFPLQMVELDMETEAIQGATASTASNEKNFKDNSSVNTPTDEAAKDLKKLGYDQELTRVRG